MVHLKPGKPLPFAILEGIPVFALPGNPAAAMISIEVIVRPAPTTIAPETALAPRERVAVSLLDRSEDLP